MPSPLAALWPEAFERTYTVWGKDVVLKALQNAEVEEVNSLAAAQPPENQMQALAILTVAAAIVSIDGQVFNDATTGQPLTLAQRATEVAGWADVLTAALHNRYNDLARIYRAAIDGVIDPQLFGDPASTTEPSETADSSARDPQATSA